MHKVYAGTLNGGLTTNCCRDKTFSKCRSYKKKPARRENKTNTRKVDKAKKLHVHGVHFIW